MNLFSKISDIVFGKTGPTCLAQLAHGQLVQKCPAESACNVLFIRASASILSTDASNQFQLVISCLDTLDEKCFLIDEKLRMTVDLCWKDLDSPSGIDSFQFIPDLTQVSKKSINDFYQVFMQCAFQRFYSRLPDSQEEFDQFINGNLVKSSNFSKSNETLVEDDGKDVDFESYVSVKESGTAFPSQSAELYLYDARFDQFVRLHEGVTVMLSDLGKYCFGIFIKKSGNSWDFLDVELILSQIITTTMSPTFNKENYSFVWNWFMDGKGPFSFSIKFNSSNDFELFKANFSKCIYETLNQEDFGKVSKADQDWITSAYEEDAIMEDALVEEEEEDEIIAPRNLRQEMEVEKNDFSELKMPEQNSNLTVGYKGDRSYVFRGDKIGVFNHSDDEQLKFQTMIPHIKNLKGEYFSPKKVLLHEQDTSMLMMDNKNDKKILKMDLTTGKVVEEWDVDENMAVNEIIPDSKYAQLTPQKTIIGINKNSIFRIDPRLSGTKRVVNESKQYATKADFSCAVTTGKGELAVASKKGDIRLYNKLNIRAKTHLPGLGGKELDIDIIDPIIGIDTTESGKWILATCKTYLLILNTELKETSATGFTKSMGEKKPVPRRLQLKPEHAALMNHQINFTVAKFSTGQDEEKTIITSTGPYVITWNFRRVKAGHLYDYQIKKYAENVVADSFKFGQDRSIIVALPSDVQMIHKSNLQTPTKMLKRICCGDFFQRKQMEIIDATAFETSPTVDTQEVPRPSFDPIHPSEMKDGKIESRRVPIPPHRMTPLKKDWLKIYTPLVEHMKLQVRMNVRSKAVELRSCAETEDIGALQKGADFVRAYGLGFELEDAMALLRLDDLFVDSFEIKDVRTLAGDNLSRAIARLVGKDGKTKYTIENTTRTRVVVADTKIHILGSFQNIKIARDSMVALIRGSSPGKVYSKLRSISARMKERF